MEDINNLTPSVDSSTVNSLGLLLVEKDGQKEEDNSVFTVRPGELLTKSGTNYYMYRYPDICIQEVNEREDVVLLSEQEFKLLLPVSIASERLEQYNKRMDFIKSIQKGDTISVVLDHDRTDVLVSGVVRYIGEIPSHSGERPLHSGEKRTLHSGIFFGIELKDFFRGKGNSSGDPHFNCGFRNAAYVSMDKIQHKSRFPTQPLQEPATVLSSSFKPNRTLPASSKQRSASSSILSSFSPTAWFSSSVNVTSSSNSPSSKITSSVPAPVKKTAEKSSSLPRGFNLSSKLFFSSSADSRFKTEEKENETEREENKMEREENEENKDIFSSEPLLSEEENDSQGESKCHHNKDDDTSLPTPPQNDPSGPTDKDFTISMNRNIQFRYTDVTLYRDEKIGFGGWADVLKGKFRELTVAVKIMHQVIVSEHNLKLMHDEINIMAQLHHPNILQFIGAVFDHPSGNPMIITEVMDTSLRKAYAEKQLTPDQQPVILSIMRDVALGLNYLHCLPDPIIHRDVSSANVLLETKGKWKAKLGDFGSAKMVQHQATTPVPGAIVYAAPEAYQPVTGRGTRRQQTTKMDVYSYGIMLCEVLTCQLPLTPLMYEDMLRKTLPDHRKIINHCTEDEANSRPSIKEVIQLIDCL